MRTVLPAKLRTYCRSFLTSVSVCVVSHMLQSYLLGVTLIIHVASYLPVTGHDSLLTVFSAEVVFVFPVHVLTFTCYTCGKLLCSLMCVWQIGVTDRLSLCLYMHAPVHYLALYIPGLCVWCVSDVHINLSRPQLLIFHFCALCRRMVCIFRWSWKRGLD